MSQTFYRVHWDDTPPFHEDHAWSATWTDAPRSADGSQVQCPECNGTGEGVMEPPCGTCGGSGWRDADRGYSCTDSAEELVDYFLDHGEPCDDDTVIVFTGNQVGNGCEMEPLAVPTGIMETLTWSELKERVRG